MVVSSFVIVTFLARPSMARVTFSSLMPRSSEIICAAGQDGDILQHGLAAVAEARSLHGRNLQAAAQLVDHERGQSLAFDVLGDDEKRTAGLHDCLKHGQQRLQVRQLLLVDENVRVFEIDAHFLGVGDEVGRDVAAVELHAFHDLQARSQATWPLRP